MPLKQKEIKKMVSRLQISILCLVETRVKKENFSRIVADMLPGWEVVNNYSKHCLGKIWICWDPGGFVIDPYDIHEQVITCKVISKDSGESWLLSVMYGATNGPDRRRLLQELRLDRATVFNMPWLLTGDFNVIRTPQEKWGKEGFSCYEKEFVDCLHNLEVDDISYTGCFHPGPIINLERILSLKNLIESCPIVIGCKNLGILLWSFRKEEFQITPRL
jgi:hypothetical protein